METPLTPLDFARRARKLYGEREAVVDGKLRLTYAQFFDRCDRWAATLQKLGVAQNDRVAYIAPNTHAQLESFYAVPQIGAVLVPINYRLTADDFAYLINHSGAKIVCAHSDYIKAAESIRVQLPTIEHFIALDGSHPGWLDYETLLAEASSDFARPKISESDLLTINYTSGTTSRPKGVMITHRNAYMNTVGTLVHEHMTCSDRYLWTLPMFHANGWTFVWTVTAAGATHVCLPKVEPRSVIDQSGAEVPHDGETVGEIVVRGNVVMAGYYNDPEATAEAMCDGWFHTGDAAVIHPDGYLEIRDRLKDVIISGGENISSVEVEGVLLRHPAVQEVAIVGLPDKRWGEAPHAFVVLRDGAVATPDELREFARSHLAHFKAPHTVTLIEALPKTATGKIQKYVLRGSRSAIAKQ